MKHILQNKRTKASLDKTDLVFIPVWVNEKKADLFGEVFALLHKNEQAFLKNYLTEVSRKPGEQYVVPMPSKPRRVIVGIEKTWTPEKFSLHIRRIVRTAKKEKLEKIGIYLDDFERDNIATKDAARLVAENSIVAHYDFSEEFKTKPKEGWGTVKEVHCFTASTAKDIKASLSEGQIIGEAVNCCRTLANYPPGMMAPEGMAEAARTVANETPSVKVRVFDEKKLKKEGMNAILAVGSGSEKPPRLIELTYTGGKKGEKPIALLGKGITFDSGGLNVKTPSKYMCDMHMDMSGGAGVIYAVSAIAKLKLPVNIIAYVPAAENMISGRSYHQRDIITTYSGKTMEIGNTDAEGRVVLADAIGYAKTKKPALMITLATLTGAAVVALGERFSGLFVKNNTALRDALEGVGEASSDAVWPLPLTEAYEKDVESDFADVINIHKNDSRYGGASTGAAFLSQFAGDQVFAHIDMAPRMTTRPEEEYLAKGAAGFGVRYFVELAKQWKEIQKNI